MGRIAGMLRNAPSEPTPLQRELDRTGKLLGAIVVAIAVIMIGTIVIVEHIRGHGRVARRVHPRRGTRRGRGARGLARHRHRRAVNRSAAHGETTRRRTTSCRGGDARLGERDRVGQDGNAHQKRNDRAHHRDGERSGGVQWRGILVGRGKRGARMAGRSTAICASSWIARSPRPIAPTTPPCATRAVASTVIGDPTEARLARCRAEGGNRLGGPRGPTAARP